MKITASQLPVTQDMEANLDTIIKTLENNPDSDWLLTPEGSLSGYCYNITHESTKEQIDQYFVVLDKLETYLKQNKRNIALGTGHYEQDKFAYNQIRYYHQGNLITAYNKQLLTRNGSGLGEHYFYLFGTDSVSIEINQSGTLVGSLLCNDAWAFPGASPDGDPYIWHKYKECDMVFVASNCATEQYNDVIYNWHDCHLSMWALEHQQHVISSSACTDMRGGLIDHVQAPSGIMGPDGKWIAKCKDSGEDSVTVEISL